MALELNRENFDTEVKKSDQLLLVDVWGPQCKPCLALMPSVDTLEKDYEGKLQVWKLNAAENRMLCAKLRVMGMPAFLFFKDGREVKRLASEDLTIHEIKSTVDDILSKNDIKS